MSEFSILLMNIKHCDNENKSTNFISEKEKKTETINIKQKYRKVSESSES